GLPNRFAREALRQPGPDDQAEISSAAATRIALLAAAVVLDDHRDVEPHERTNVRGEHTLGRADQHELVDAGAAADNLDHTRIELTAIAVEIRAQLDLLRVVEGRQRIDRGIERMPAHAARDLHAAFTAAARDSARRRRRIEQRRDVELIRIREAGLLAGDRADADPLIDAEDPFLHVAVLDGPAHVAGRLKVQIAVIEPMRHELRERAIDVREAEPGGLE